MDDRKKKFGKKVDNTDDSVIDEASDVVGKKADTKNSSVDGNDQASAGGYDYNPKKVDGHGSSVKQEAIAKAISGNGSNGSGAGAAPSSFASSRSIPYSGTDARIIDNASGTPSFNKSDRSDSRYGQKTDNTARHINYVPSETYIIETDGPKPLSESADGVQGSLGHPDNAFARIQKTSEAFPGALNFERSVDEITDDTLIFTQGQQVTYRDSGETYDDIDPTKTFDKDLGDNIPYTIHRGNYVPRELKVKYGSDGELEDFYYIEDYATTPAAGDLQAERACTHTVTAANRAEIDRQVMASKAGNEVESTWSPIPYAYPEPTRDLLFITTIEKQLGANTFVPVKMSSKAHSYALNKAAKDGMRPESGGAEIGLGPVFVKNNSTAYDKFSFAERSNRTSIFHRRFTSKGAPSAIVAMNDSVAKYHNRGDLLTQPRSFNMILKQGLTNYKTFKIDPEFARVFDNVNVFSTIDRGYDPSSPVCIMDSIGLVNVYSFNELGSCFRKYGISKFVENNLTSDEKAAFYRNEVTAIIRSDHDLEQSFTCMPTILKDLENDVDSLIVNDAILEEAAKVIRQNAVKVNGHTFLESNYIVPIMKKVEDESSISSKILLLAFCNNDSPMVTEYSADSVVMDIQYGAASTGSFNVNSGTFDVGGKLIYNNYLAAYYKNRQNYYYIELRDPYTDGIKTWLRRNYGLMSKVTNVEQGGSISWPIHYSTKSFSAYSYLVMMSLKFIQEQRSKAMLDILNYADNFGYPISDTDDTANYPALGGTQYGQSDIFELLETRQMTPAIAIRWLYPELYTNLKSNTGSVRTLMPFYMNEQSFDFDPSNNTIKLSHDRATMSYPVTKHGVRWGFSDDVYGLSERDFRLLLDMIIAPPSFWGQDSGTYAKLPEVYKYSQSNDGLIVLPSDVTQIDLLRTPRELGYLCPVVGGYVFPEPAALDAEHDNPAIVGPGGADTLGYTDTIPCTRSIVGHSAFRVVCWVIEDGTPATSILQSGSSVITRASNFTQKYYIFNVTDSNPGEALGICLNSAKSLDGSSDPITGISSFVPFTNGSFSGSGQTVLSDRPPLFTYSKGLWTRLQKLPFNYNPFDFGGSDVTCDPYSFNYLFGLLGFKASDYKEDLYNRLTDRMANGWKFISDPFVESSLLVK